MSTAEVRSGLVFYRNHTERLIREVHGFRNIPLLSPKAYTVARLYSVNLSQMVTFVSTNYSESVASKLLFTL